MCISGAARSFATPLVLSQLRHNLIESLASHGAHKRLFLAIKTADSAKLNGGTTERNYKITSAHAAAEIKYLLHALEQPWLKPLIGEAVILNGSGTFNGSGWRGAGSPVRASDP